MYFIFMAIINLVPEQPTSYRLFLTVSLGTIVVKYNSNIIN